MKRARAAVDNCAYTWEVEGESIRRLTVAEAIEARAAQLERKEYLNEPLPLDELRNTKFEYKTPAERRYDPTACLAPAWMSKRFVSEANAFAVAAGCAPR